MNSPETPEAVELVERDKGDKWGECNRTGCTNVPAFWYNMYTQRWYCATCAQKINAASTHAICDRR